MPREDDRSEDHLQWLVEQRSANQQVTLDLYVLFSKNEIMINRNIVYANISQELAGIAFSLWRAVFFIDLARELDDQLIDVRSRSEAPTQALPKSSLISKSFCFFFQKEALSIFL